jgi:hypothetical protein
VPKAHAKPGNGAAVIIHNDGQPGPRRRAILPANPEIYQRMIGLPDIVGVCGLASIEEIERGAVGFRPGVCQGYQRGIELLV